MLSSSSSPLLRRILLLLLLLPLSACASLGSLEGSNVCEGCLWLDCVDCKDEDVSGKLSDDSEKDLENFRNASFMIYVPFLLIFFFSFFFIILYLQ